MSSHLVILDRPLLILPKLAIAIGLNEAIILQQLYFLNSVDKCGKVLADGNKYIFNTYETWRSSYFPFFSEATIQRTFASLEESGYVVSCQPEGGISRRKYYRIHEENLLKLKEETYEDSHSNMISTSSQSDMIDTANCGVPLTETTSYNNTLSLASESPTEPSSPMATVKRSDEPPATEHNIRPIKAKKPSMPKEFSVPITTELMKIDGMDFCRCTNKSTYFEFARRIWAVEPTLTKDDVSVRLSRLKVKYPWWDSFTAAKLVSHWGELTNEISTQTKPQVKFCN